MADVTVEQLASTVGVAVERLLSQMREAGLSHSRAGESVSEEQKQVVELTDIIIVANYSDSVTAFEVAKAIYNAGFRKVVE